MELWIIVVGIAIYKINKTFQKSTSFCHGLKSQSWLHARYLLALQDNAEEAMLKHLSMIYVYPPHSYSSISSNKRNREKKKKKKIEEGPRVKSKA